MGRPAEVKPRLTKVVLPFRSHYFMVLGKARRLRELPEFMHVFIRPSLTAEARKHAYNLRQEAHSKNQALGHGELVVYRGQIVRVSEIPKLREQLNQGK
ncbi:hypothetical protein Aduo_009663 [Ancylostoma duodenale]